MTTTHTTRESWLLAAVEELRPIFAERIAALNATIKDEAKQLPAEVPAEIQISVGWTSGKATTRTLGVCHSKASSDDVHSIFIAPTMESATQILGVLVHELVHAIDDCQHGHTGPFRRIAKAMGLEGQMTATTVGEGLEPVLAEIAARLGSYPHKRLVVAPKGAGSGRMVKVACSDGVLCDDYSFYTTRKWIDAYELKCPICQSPAHPA